MCVPRSAQRGGHGTQLGEHALFDEGIQIATVRLRDVAPEVVIAKAAGTAIQGRSLFGDYRCYSEVAARIAAISPAMPPPTHKRSVSTTLLFIDVSSVKAGPSPSMLAQITLSYPSAHSDN